MLWGGQTTLVLLPPSISLFPVALTYNHNVSISHPHRYILIYMYVYIYSIPKVNELIIHELF
jgi:hypothetical protein